MKKLQPEMEKIKQRHPDDRMKQQQEMMELYKREKVSPLAGCLPIVIQIPVFFALYKVIYVTIELRHAPFFGWIKDLSAPDPTSLFNLFGLIPWDPPYVMMIGAWPIIMGITMWMQMRLNPAPPDPIQAQLFNWMPLIFTLYFGGLSGRSRDLLGVEQRAVDPAAIGNHEAAGRQSRFLRQYPQQPAVSETEERGVNRPAFSLRQ